MEKDIERQKRLNEVYRHLYSAGKIVTQKDFADNIHLQRTALSAAMNGNKAYLTNNLFTKICAAYPKVYNYEYLTEGKGDLLLDLSEDEMAKEKRKKQIDNNKLLDALLDAKEETINSLKQQLKAKDEVIEAKEQLIASLRQQLPYSQKECSGYMGVADKQY